MSKSIDIKDLAKAKELSDQLLEVRKAISAYCPASCEAKLVIEFPAGYYNPQGPATARFNTNHVLPVLRSHEDHYEGELYKLGVNIGPRARNAWEDGRAASHQVRLELQMKPGFAEYLQSVINYDHKAMEEFEKGCAINKEVFQSFYDFIRKYLR